MCWDENEATNSWHQEKKSNNAFTKLKPRPEEINFSLLLSEGKDQNYSSGLKAM